MVGRKKGFAAVLIALLAMAGCDAGGGSEAGGPLPGEEVLATFEPGAARADVVAALPDGELVGAPDGQVDHGYVVDDYLIDGARIAVLWVHDPSTGLPNGDPRTDVLPVIFVDDSLDGSGWDHYDERVGEWMLPDRWAGVGMPTESTDPGPEVRSF